MARRYSKLLFVFAFAISAQADFIPLDPINLATWTPGASLTFNQFDPSLGTLTAVDLLINARIGSTFTFAQNQAHQAGQNDTVSGQLTAILKADIRDQLSSLAYSVSASRLMYETTWANPTGTLDLSGVVSLWKSWTSGLDAFEGDADWSLRLSAGSKDMFIYWPVGVSMTDSAPIFLPFYVAVTYEYDPVETVSTLSELAPIPNPEPSEFIGIAAAALVAWLANRKQISFRKPKTLTHRSTN